MAAAVISGDIVLHQNVWFCPPKSLIFYTKKFDFLHQKLWFCYTKKFVSFTPSILFFTPTIFSPKIFLHQTFTKTLIYLTTFFDVRKCFSFTKFHRLQDDRKIIGKMLLLARIIYRKTHNLQKFDSSKKIYLDCSQC